MVLQADSSGIGFRFQQGDEPPKYQWFGLVKALPRVGMFVLPSYTSKVRPRCICTNSLKNIILCLTLFLVCGVRGKRK